MGALHRYQRDLTYSARTQDHQRLIELADNLGASSIHITAASTTSGIVEDIKVTWDRTGPAITVP